MSALPVAARWFEVTQLSAHVARVTEPHVHPLLSACAFVIAGSDRTAVVDTGMGIGRFRDAHPALAAGADVLALLTHAHFDHIGSAWEFSERAIHSAEAGLLAEPEPATLRGGDFDAELWAELERAGVPYADRLIDAVPHAGFELDAYAIAPAPATTLLSDGDVVELGDVALRVLHLPGHSPGCIALLDERRGELFAGDVVYDAEPLLDSLPESSPADYRTSMRRLLELDVRVVHGGHGGSFDRARLQQIAQDYLLREQRAA